MSVIKITGEYKVRIEFEAERDANTRPIADIREGVCKFPVLSYSLLYKKKSQGGVGFVDQEFARWCSDHNCDWYDSNFYNGEDVTTLSSCCRL